MLRTKDSSRGRNGGLFSSSSSSSEAENDGSPRVNAAPPLLKPSMRSNSHDLRRRSMFSPSIAGDGGGRKGLFEKDDDGDSLEAFRERVKLRQSRKKSEMKAQLEAATKEKDELETQLAAVIKVRYEGLIRTQECQRIIEKHNKQLMKASDKMARHSEQFELQTAEMQTRLNAMTEKCKEKEKERDEKEKEMQQEMDMQRSKYEKVLQEAETTFRDQQEKNANKLREVEQKLREAEQKPRAEQVKKSDEYQNLLKRCEDAEAISRGLNFQLEKEQQEKKYLRKQLTALQATVGSSAAAATAASVGFFPDGLSKEDSANPRDSVATVTGDADLASFDFTAKGSAPSSPVAAAPRQVSSPTSGASSPSRSRSRSRGFSASSFTEEPPKTTLREGKRRAASAQTLQTSFEPSEKSGDDKAAAANANGKSVGISVTFFEKLSSRFKRGSSPRNGLDISKLDEDSRDGALTGETGFASPLPPRRAFAHNKVLKERPRMYVAKSPSHHEDESSDSIFGSDSSSSDSSDDDEMPPPPPPPPISVHEVPAQVAPPPSAHVDIPSHVITSDTSADADSSSLSESDDDADGKRDWQEESDKPTRLPTRFADPLEMRGPPINPLFPLSAISSSSSSSSSDDDSDEPDVEKRQPLHVDAKKVESSSESSSSSAPSSSDDDEKVVGEIKTKVHQKVRKASLSSLDRHGNPSSRSRTSSRTREKKRSLSGGDTSRSTSKSRMNEYMEDRAKKRNEKLKRKQEKEHEETKKKQEYEKEWEKMAQEERERKRKQQQARRNGKRRPASMKTVRVSQMRQQMNSKQQQKEHKEPLVPPPPHPNDPLRPQGDGSVDADNQPRYTRRKSECKTSESEAEEERPPVFRSPSTETPPLPPEATTADTELYLRQQARLRERHELQMKKKLEADEADLVRGDIHRRVEMWAFGKELLHMILTLDQISSNDALKKCQLMVVQSPDDDTVRKAYRNIIRVVHPDKLRGATISEQLEAKELFTVLNQAFEKFKN